MEANGGYSSYQGLLTFAAKRLTLEPYTQAMLVSHVNLLKPLLPSPKKLLENMPK